MLISAVEKHKGSTYKIYVDGEFFAVMDAEIILTEHLRAGREVDEDYLEGVRRACDERRARERALHLLEYRSHSKKELADKLLRSYPPEVCAQTVDRLEEVGLLDDEDYARRLLSDLIRIKHFGKQRIRQELTRRGISREIQDIVLEEEQWDPQEELQVVLLKKYARYLTDEKGFARVQGALLRLGYSYGQIREALQPYRDGEME